MRKRPPRPIALILVLLASLVLLAAASSDESGAEGALLGEISFPNSGAEEAQDPFLRGVLYLHNFEYEDAAIAFREAQKADPDFALAYWGEAMTYNHPLWAQQDREAATAVLQRLGPTPEARAAAAPTAREKAYLDAVETLYGTTEETSDLGKEERDLRYRDAMAELAARYPDDHEAITFHALAILGSAHDGRDFRTYMRAAATAEPVWESNRKHPGAAHYLIHSYDDPVHAPLGLPMARAYSEIAPAAAHAQHMTSHIFVSLGLWNDVVEANEVASDVEAASARRRGEPERPCGHYPFWLEYGYLQLGQYARAAEVMDACAAGLAANPTRGQQSYFADMRARYVIDTEDWTAADRWRAEIEGDGRATYHFISGLAALRRGDRRAARRALARLDAAAAEASDRFQARAVAEVLTRELGALLLIADDKRAEGLDLLAKAVEREQQMSYMFGPPAVAKPSLELLGEELLLAGEHAAAADAFRRQLERTPRRARTLMGLVLAERVQGDRQAAEDALAELDAIWEDAEPEVRAWLDQQSE